jgi:hypothetical protein
LDDSHRSAKKQWPQYLINRSRRATVSQGLDEESRLDRIDNRAPKKPVHARQP